MKEKILVIEDECSIRNIISSYLVKNGYDIIEAEDGLEALAVIKTQSIDLIVLDIMIPHIDGFTVCKFIRECSMVPIIMLTAKTSEDDKLKGYELGADDYITKPFSPKVLIAKIKALLKRTNTINNFHEINRGNICINTKSHIVSVNDKYIELTFKEYELLKLLMKNEGKVFSREEILTKIWGYDYEGNTRTVDTHIKRIRGKLGYESRHIITLIRSGYKFEVRE